MAKKRKVAGLRKAKPTKISTARKAQSKKPVPKKKEDMRPSVLEFRLDDELKAERQKQFKAARPEEEQTPAGVGEEKQPKKREYGNTGQSPVVWVDADTPNGGRKGDAPNPVRHDCC